MGLGPTHSSRAGSPIPGIRRVACLVGAQLGYKRSVADETRCRSSPVESLRLRQNYIDINELSIISGLIPNKPLTARSAFCA